MDIAVWISTLRFSGFRFVLLSTALFVSALLFTAPAEANAPIKIAMITAKTGPAGVSNVISFDGARFVVDEINAQGGILGRKVELLEYDNKSTPEGSAEAGKLAIKDGAISVVGCNWSSHSKALAEVLQAAKIPMVTHMSTNEAVTKVGDYIFRTCYTDSYQGLGLARFSHTTLEDDTAVVLVDKNRSYSQGLADTFTAAFERLGGRVLWRGEYDMDSVDYESLLHDVAKHDPDALFVPGSYADVAGFFGMARDMNARWHLLSADGIGIKLIEYIGDRANGIFYSGHWSKWADTDASRAFVKQYESKVGPVSEDTIALVYDSFMVIKSAIERAGTTEGPQLRKAISETPGYRGVTGVIRFDENGDPIKPMFINKFQFGGVMYIDMVYP